MLHGEEREDRGGRTARDSRRLEREARTVAVMIAMYCRDHHGGQPAPVAARPSSAGAAGGPAAAVTRSPALCESCAALLAHSSLRIERCVFGERKPTCARCTVHCFRAEQREAIRLVMRYAGPRMTLRHPYLALRHLLDRRRTPAASSVPGSRRS